MKKNITITEIAKLAEVSPSTVSLVLNGKAGVGPEARERVLRIARENNYKGVTAGGLNKRHKTLLFVSIVKNGKILNINHKAFIADYIDGAQHEAGDRGYSLEVTAFNEFDPQLIVDHINNSFARGVVILGTELAEKDIEYFLKLQIPAVFIDILYPRMPYDFVDMNNDSAVYNIVSHLVNMGHTSIGLVTGSYETSNFLHRKNGFMSAMDYFGLTFKKENLFTVSPTFEGAYKDMMDLLADVPQMPTALFCVNDIIALGCVKALRNSGYRVPEDVSVAGFDNLPMSAMSEPPLTTVNVSKRRISMKAVQLLVQRIKDGGGTPYEKIMVGGEVIERSSVLDMNDHSGEEE